MKIIVVLVDNEVAGTIPVLPSLPEHQQEGMVAAFTSSPTFVVIEGQDPPPMGYVWNGTEFYQPAGWEPT